MSWLENSVALITGGGSGLGRSLVARFIEEGAKVGVLERNQPRADELESEFGNAVSVTVGDVTNYQDNARAVAHTVERFGRLDNFLANAGVFDFFKPLADYDGEELGAAFDELTAVNVKGGLLGARAALPELLKTRGGIVFTISNAGFYPGGGGPIYTASKHALVGLVRQLAYELAPKVRVNGVAPGGMRTGLSGLAATGTLEQSLDQIDEFEDMVSGITPLAMCPAAEQYAGPFVLLCSKQNAAPMTGVVINTDGGLGVRGIMNVRGGDEL